MNCQSKNRFAGKYFNRHSIDSGHAQAHGSEELAQSSEQQSAALMSQNFSVRWSLAFWNCPLQISIEWPRMFVADMIQFYWIDLYKANILKYTEFFFSKFSYNFSVQNFSRIHSASEKKYVPRIFLSIQLRVENGLTILNGELVLQRFIIYGGESILNS